MISHRQRLISPDALAILILFALWLLFFWRLFTPIQSDQASLVKGDFSGQFVAFGGYQYQRLSAGEIPLWNPYNNGGLPFVADTQAAVFYPPRLATIGLSSLGGGWRYHALELEMTAHVLAYTLMMYALVRRLTLGHPGSVFGGLVAAVIAGYGGFISSYPPLQLALLEAAIWLPLAVIGIVEATRHETIRLPWLAVTGLALGLSWTAGHPQTSWFLTYLLVAYFGYRVYTRRYRWPIFVIGTALFGLITVGMAAAQLLPGLEYLMHTTRTGLGFDAKGNGLLFQDITQFLLPGALGPWFPLYVGITGLVLAMLALWRRLPGSLFWGIAGLIALILSVGANSPLFHALYNLLPGMRYFRGQERAAYLVANCLAILAGLGMTHMATWDRLKDFKATRRIQQALLVLTVICVIVAGAVFISLLSEPDVYTQRVSGLAFSAIVAGLTLALIPWALANQGQRGRLWLVVGLVVFDLFTVNIDNSNYEHVPPESQLSMTPPPLVAAVLEDGDLPFRVDGNRGLLDNYGSLYDVMDMRGISPLFLDGPHTIIDVGAINPLAWEVFAVRYVYSDQETLPVPSTIVTSGEDRYGPVNLLRLENPRPFAHLIYDAAVVDSDAFAYALLNDPRFDTRNTVILNREPGIELNGDIPENSHATVTEFAPERFSIAVSTDNDAILSVANPDYPGWTVTIDGQSADILRAYGALSAVVIQAGEHTVVFDYAPRSFTIGAILSLFTWGALVILGIVIFTRGRTRHVHE